MAAVPFVKIVVGGKIGSTDTWSCGFAAKVLTGGVPTSADMNGIAHAAALLFAVDVWDHASGWKTFRDPQTDWSKINTYYYPGGSGVSTVSGTFAITADPGTNSSSFTPPQACMVVSLHTGNTGRANRGRVFMPASPAMVAGGQMSPATATNTSPLMAQFLRDINAMSVGAFTFNACIGTALCPSIVSVSVDTVVDTQRRRRDKQLAAANIVTAI